MPLDNLLPILPEALMSRRPLLIAGPCSAESREQVLATAEALAGAGIGVFRAGVWKPRTKPGSFEGRGAEALPWLAEVRERTGMLTTTEVATAAHARLAVESDIDIIWIGARTTANPFAVQEIADYLATLPEDKREQITVLVKNPVNPDLELWIGALERIYGAGVHRLGAIHRGFSAYGRHLFRNPPKWRIPIELHRRFPALPLICDPSHIGGRRDAIESLSQQALGMKFDGLIIETHCDPDSALSDKEQQLTPNQLVDILGRLHIPEQTVSTPGLDELRSKIDRLDDELLELLAKRMRVAREIGLYKKEHDMSVVQPDRYNDLMQRRVDAALSLDLGADFIRNVLEAIHEESVRQQLDI